MTILLQNLSHYGLWWRCVLILYLFEAFRKLILSHVIELAQLIDLAQCEFGLAKIMQPRLAVVLG